MSSLMGDDLSYATSSNQIELTQETGESCGFPAPHPAPAQRIGDRAEGAGCGRPSDRVLHFPIADREEGAPCVRADRYLRQDGDVFEASRREVGYAGGPPAQGSLQEKTR